MDHQLISSVSPKMSSYYLKCYQKMIIFNKYIRFYTHSTYLFTKYILWFKKLFSPFLIFYFFVYLSHRNYSDYQTN